MEERPHSHKCGSDEVEVGEAYYGMTADGQKQTARPPSAAVAQTSEGSAGGSDFEDSIEDAGAREVLSSDPSFYSGDAIAAGKRKRRRHESSDEDVASPTPSSQRRRGALRTASSDDELPLGQRATELQRSRGSSRASAHRPPASARRRRSSASGQGDEEEMEESEAERLLTLAGGGRPRGGHQPQKRPPIQGKGPAGRASVDNDSKVRFKVKVAFQQALELAVKELRNKEDMGGEAAMALPSPATVAAAAENALMQLCGELHCCG